MFAASELTITERYSSRLYWTDAVGGRNEFMQREVKQVRRLSDVTDADACELETCAQKTRKINKNDLFRHK